MMNMKFLSAIAVVLVLIVAPIGSYFYLRAGLKYRLESQNQLLAPEVDSIMKRQILNVISDHTAALVHLGGNNDTQGINLLQQIDERIVDRDFFEIVSNADSTTIQSKNKVRFVGSDHINGLDSIQFVLVDTAGVLRHLYYFNEDHSKTLIRHLSVVIPMPQSREIKLNREIQDL